MARPKVVAVMDRNKGYFGWIASNNPTYTTVVEPEELLETSGLLPLAEIAIPGLGEEALHCPPGYVVLYEYPFLIGLRFPLHSVGQIFH